MERDKPLKSFERIKGTETPVGEVSLTKQAFGDDCNINKIMARHMKTGLVEHVNPREPMYGDFSQVNDFHSALERVTEAQEQFALLPSAVRNLVQNDPERLLQALTDPEETAMLAEAGLPMPEDFIPWTPDLGEAARAATQVVRKEADALDDEAVAQQKKETPITGGE